jgi:hypothetical protein
MTTRRKTAHGKRAKVGDGRWSQTVAESLRRSAERSQRRKAPAFASAMSMLSFYINRAGRTLDPHRRGLLEGAKRELRKLYGR